MGFTNTMVDDVYFFIETINPTNENEYLHDNKWKTMKTRWKLEKYKISTFRENYVISNESSNKIIFEMKDVNFKYLNTVLYVSVGFQFMISYTFELSMDFEMQIQIWIWMFPTFDTTNESPTACWYIVQVCFYTCICF